MFSRPDGFRAKSDIRVRPVPEWDGCIVFDPGSRRLSELNLTAWFALTLCDGRPVAAMRGAFQAALGARVAADLADRYLTTALFQLAAAGLVRRDVSDRCPSIFAGEDA